MKSAGAYCLVLPQVEIRELVGYLQKTRPIYLISPKWKADTTVCFIRHEKKKRKKKLQRRPPLKQRARKLKIKDLDSPVALGIASARDFGRPRGSDPN